MDLASNRLGSPAGGTDLVSQQIAAQRTPHQQIAHESVWPVFLSTFMKDGASPECADGTEFLDGQCVGVCRYGMADLFGAEHDCQNMQFNLMGGGFMAGFSILIWFFVILRISVHRRNRADRHARDKNF